VGGGGGRGASAGLGVEGDSHGRSGLTNVKTVENIYEVSRTCGGDYIRFAQLEANLQSD